MNDILEKVLASHQKMAVGQGLLLAQTICRQKLLEAFDCDKTAHKIVLDIIERYCDTNGVNER